METCMWRLDYRNEQLPVQCGQTDPTVVNWCFSGRGLKLWQLVLMLEIKLSSEGVNLKTETFVLNPGLKTSQQLTCVPH